MDFLSESKNNWPRIKEIASVCVVFVLVLAWGAWSINWFLQLDKPANLQASVLPQDEAPVQDNVAASVEPEATIELQQKPNAAVVAKSAIAVEFDQEGQGTILFEQNSHERLPIASLAKMMMALVVLDNYDLNQQVTIDKGAMAQVGVQGVLQEGQVLTVKNLLYIALIESSNRAAYQLSEIMGTDRFVELMNQVAQDLGLTDTYFADPTGLDERSYSTANNVVLLSAYMFKHYPLFAQVVGLKEYKLYLPDGSLHHILQNTNELLGKESIIGGKTGYTDAAKGCFMVLQRHETGKDIIYVVLGADDRFLQMQNLIDRTAQLQETSSHQ